MMSFLTSKILLPLALGVALSSALFAQEKQIVLGGKEPWRIQSQENLSLSEGLRGFPSLTLRAFEPFPASEADLYLTFEAPNLMNLRGNYTQTQPARPVFVSTDYARRGSASAFFVGTRSPLILSAEDGSLFTPNSGQEQFTISFWLYSNQNHDSEIVMSWKGLIENNKIWQNQSLVASFSDGKLKWTMNNLFFGSGLKARDIEMTGITPLKPKSWSHHTLRYDSKTGLLEYFVDNMPEGLVQVFEEGDRSKTPLSLFIGSVNDRQLIFGENFTGAMDDIFISRSWLGLPLSALYTLDKGEMTTEVIDLGHPNSKLLQVNTLQTTPNATYLDYQYRISNDIKFENEAGKSLKQVDGEWRTLKANEILSDLDSGRYLQLRVNFLPEGSRQFTPALSRITLSYQSNIPSGAPTLLSAVAKNGEITLNWLPALSSSVKGYRIYYGTEPHVYRGEGQEDSPIDVGNTTSYMIKGLENGVLYYMSLKAYGEGDRPSLSAFSNEVNARPLDSYPKSAQSLPDGASQTGEPQS